MASILIVDDDAAFRASLAEALTDLDHRVIESDSAEAGMRRLQQERPAAAIVDLCLPGQDGLAFLREAAQLAPAMPCIMLTAYASGTNTIEAMRLGAFDHMTKPVGRDALLAALDRALRHSDAGPPAPGARAARGGEELVGGSEAMRQVFKRIGQAADSDATVLVVGETGTGKELVARALHRSGRRAARPFVAVNCAAIPAGLMESELFGHVRGAFSGAASDRPGRFREADGGTLFLDEIGDMALSTQARILRALQEREVVPVGGSVARPVDVRIVAATHRDLPAAVREGTFREDLWYRLQVITLVLPPLRDRLGDVLPLAEHFLRAMGGDAPKRLTPAAERRLLAHDWPGNVRELRNAMERAAVLTHGPFIGAEHLDLAGRAPEAQAGRPARIDWDGPLAEAVAQVEREMILRALAAAGDNRADAARRLGISRQQLYRKLEQLNLKSDAADPECPIT